jgi:hypothetical protein
MDRLRSILPSVLRKRGLLGHAVASLVIQKAQEWIDSTFPTMPSALKAITYKDGELTVQAENSTAAQECHAAQGKLREMLKNECTEATIRSIRIIRSSGEHPEEKAE